MSKSLKTKSEYFVELLQELNDELDIASGACFNLANCIHFGKLKDEVLAKQGFDAFDKYINEQETDVTWFKPSTLDDDDDDELLSENNKLQILTMIIKDTVNHLSQVRRENTYKKLTYLVPDKDVTLLASFEKQIRRDVRDLRDIFIIHEFYFFGPFNKFYDNIFPKLEKAVDTKGRVEFINQVYEIETCFADFMDSMGDHNFEWTEDQSVIGNWLFNQLCSYEANLYYLLLFYEEQTMKLDLLDNPNFNHNLEYLEVKQERLDDAKAMKEAGIGYDPKTEKNTNK